MVKLFSLEKIVFFLNSKHMPKHVQMNIWRLQQQYEIQIEDVQNTLVRASIWNFPIC